MADKFPGGTFGGIPKPLGWDFDQVPKFAKLPKDVNDNPFFTQTASGPAQTTPADRKQLETTMADWYKAGRPSPFKNVLQQLDTSADLGVARLMDMMPGFPKINAKNWDAMLAGTEPSNNVEDRTQFDPTDFLPNGQPAPINAFEKTPSPLDTITAGLNAPGGALQPVLSVPASGRIQKTGDDPIADLVAQKGDFSPLDFMLGIAGGPRLGGKPVFAGQSPPVAIDLTAPNMKMTVNQPFTSPVEQASIRADQAFNVANEGGTLPTKLSTQQALEREKQQMLANILAGLTENVVPFKKVGP